MIEILETFHRISVKMGKLLNFIWLTLVKTTIILVTSDLLIAFYMQKVLLQLLHILKRNKQKILFYFRTGFTRNIR